MKRLFITLLATSLLASPAIAAEENCKMPCCEKNAEGEMKCCEKMKEKAEQNRGEHSGHTDPTDHSKMEHGAAH